MEFMRKTAGLTLWDHKRNEEILKNLKVETVSKFIQNYRANWKNHIERMDSNRIPNNRFPELQTTWKKKPRKTVKKME
jgi:hypothetical protein